MARPWGRSEPLVRYVSPFGYPAWMTRRRAERRLVLDARRWRRYLSVGCLTQREQELFEELARESEFDPRKHR